MFSKFWEYLRLFHLLHNREYLPKWRKYQCSYPICRQLRCWLQFMSLKLEI